MRIELFLMLLIVFISSLLLFYIFDNLKKISNECRINPSEDICKEISHLTLTSTVIVLMISSFIFIIFVVGYIMITR